MIRLRFGTVATAENSVLYKVSGTDVHEEYKLLCALVQVGYKTTVSTPTEILTANMILKKELCVNYKRINNEEIECELWFNVDDDKDMLFVGRFVVRNYKVTMRFLKGILNIWLESQTVVTNAFLKQEYKYFIDE